MFHALLLLFRHDAGVLCWNVTLRNLFAAQQPVVAVAEGLLARGHGAEIDLPARDSASDAKELNPWEFCFGEGFHGFVASVAENDTTAFEKEWAECGVPFLKLGTVTGEARLSVKGRTARFSVPLGELRLAWLKEGYWE